MSVAQKCKAAEIMAANATEETCTYYEVSVSSRKDLFGFMYLPGRKHIVDKATLDALGDAVAEKKKIQG